MILHLFYSMVSNLFDSDTNIHVFSRRRILKRFIARMDIFLFSLLVYLTSIIIIILFLAATFEGSLCNTDIGSTRIGVVYKSQHIVPSIFRSAASSFTKL